MTTVYFVRHARPNYENHDDLLRELSPKGLTDRRLVTEFLKDRNIDVVLSSPYKRAVDTVAELADLYGHQIETVDAFRERKVDRGWIEDFASFSQRQWQDFSFKLPEGECLQEVQDRNIAALNRVIQAYRGKNIVIGGHGTAISTVINYYDKTFGYDGFVSIKDRMPWVVEFVFDENADCRAIYKHDLY